MNHNPSHNLDPFPFDKGRDAIGLWLRKEQELTGIPQAGAAPPDKPPAPPDQAKLAAQAEREAIIKAVFQAMRPLVESTVNRALAPIADKVQINEQRIDKLMIGLSEAERDLAPLVNKVQIQEQKTDNLMVRLSQDERKVRDMEIRAAEKVNAEQIPLTPEQEDAFERVENAAMARAQIISADGIS